MKYLTLRVFTAAVLGVATLSLAALGSNAVRAVTAPTLTLQFTPDTWTVPGAPVQLTATVTNTDPTNPLTDAKVKIMFDTGKFKPTFVSAEDGFTCHQMNGEKHERRSVVCDGGTIPAGGSAAIVFEIPTSKPGKTTKPTMFMVNAKIRPYDVRASANLAVTPWFQPDLALKGKATPQASLVGGTITYKFMVKNKGFAPSTPTTVLVTLPDATTQSVNIPALNWGEYSSLFTITYNPTAAGNAVATFSVDPTNLIVEHDETNNLLTLTTQVYTDLAELSVSQTEPDSVNGGDLYSKTVMITNNGTLPAADIKMKDEIQGSKVLSVTGDHGFTCTIGYHWDHWIKKSTGYKCVGGLLNPGETATITVALEASTKGDKSKNKIVVDPKNLIIESNEDNNVLSDSLMLLGNTSWGWHWGHH